MDKKISIAIIVAVILLIVVAAVIYFLMQPNAGILGNLNQQITKSYNIQGMKVEVLKQGSGAESKTGDTVSVHYVGTLENGTKFDSSIDRGQAFEFKLGENRVIQGWELGVKGMKVGEKRKLTIPPELGYGSQAIGNIIPANSTLIFEVELLGIK